jgi:3-phosphoshikimate 1-carboxyvinyltransferase
VSRTSKESTEAPESAVVAPAGPLIGTMSVPGDKSISHRAAMLAAIADGVTRIDNFAPGADCQSTLQCLRELGSYIQIDGSSVVIHGRPDGLLQAQGPLDCGNSGTTMRLLAGLLAGGRCTAQLTGDESLRKRPMGRIIEPLKKMGADIGSDSGHAPLEVTGSRKLNGIEYRMPVPSAQVKSCILLAGLNASGETAVYEVSPTRDHTERLLEWFKARISIEEMPDDKRISVTGGFPLTAKDISVPGDISSAAFFMVAAAALPGSDLTIRDVGLNQSRAAVIEVLQTLGADVQIIDRRVVCNEERGDIRIRGGLDASPRKAARLDGKTIAGIIDEIPILSVLGTQLPGGLEISDASELRIKETDRISAIVSNLRAMGADVEEYDDGFRVGPSRLARASIDSRGDHRIAMAFAIAALLADGETTIHGAECVDISYPGFFETLRSLQ